MKNITALNRSRIMLFIVVFGVVFLSACPPTNIFEVRELPFYTLFQGQIGLSDHSFFVIQTEEEYQQFFGDSSDDFDFSNNMIFATYKGQLYNGGYGYEIVSIIEEEESINVSILFTPCSPCTRNITSPYHIVAVEKVEKPVFYEEISTEGEIFTDRVLSFYSYPDLNINVDETSYFVIKSEEEYQSLTGEQSDNFDFENEMLLAAFLGSLPNGGYGWEITKVVEVLNEIIVEVQFTSCGNSCTRAFSYEVDVVATERVDKDVYFLRINIE